MLKMLTDGCKGEHESQSGLCHQRESGSRIWTPKFYTAVLCNMCFSSPRISSTVGSYFNAGPWT